MTVVSILDTIDLETALGDVAAALASALENADLDAMQAITDAVLQVYSSSRQADTTVLSPLLYGWHSALSARMAANMPLQHEQIMQCFSWFDLLDRCMRGDDSNLQNLIDDFEAIAWLPPLPKEMQAQLITQLALSTNQTKKDDTLTDPVSAIAFADTTAATESDAAQVANTIEAMDNTHDIGIADSHPDQASDGLRADDLFIQLSTITVDEFTDTDSPAETISDNDESAFASVDIDNITDVSSNEIWISQEELALTIQAINEQVLLPLQGLSVGDDDLYDPAAWEEICFQIELICNAIELLNLPSVKSALEVLLVQMQQTRDTDCATTVLTFCTGLVGYLEDPSNEDNTLLLASLATQIHQLSEDWQSNFIDDAAKVRVGIDPALRAAAKRQASDADVVLDVADDVSVTVLDGMRRELPGNAQRLGQAIRQLIETQSTDPIDEARRVAHTLKGDANTVGVRGLANINHALEDIFIALLKSTQHLHGPLSQLLERSADAIEEIADHLLGRGAAPENLLEIYQQLLDWTNALTFGEELAEHVVPDLSLASNTATEVNVIPVQQVQVQESDNRELTVSIRVLDELQRSSGEMLVASRQLDEQINTLLREQREQANEVQREAELIAQLDDLISLRSAALESAAMSKAGDIDPLELDQYNELHTLSRRLIENHGDKVEHVRRIDTLLNRIDELRSHNDRLQRDTQRLILRTRMVPFAQLLPRLQRIVRQTARDVGKNVELQINGEQTLLEADLIDRLAEPLAHVLRNAIDHGIETAEQRAQLSKTAVGKIDLTVSTLGDSAQIIISDDGRGLDLPAIARKAAELGLLEEDIMPTDELLQRLILLPGFSTRDQTTQISGRGVGMDIINQRIREVRGTLALHSHTGQGLTLTLRVPLNQSVANVLVIANGKERLAILANTVERIVSLNDVVIDDDSGQLLYAGNRYAADELSAYFDTRAFVRRHRDQGNVLIVNTTLGQRQAVFVPNVNDAISVVLKPVSPLIPPLAGVLGLTLLGDGVIAPVVDLATLIENQSSHEYRFARQWQPAVMSLPRIVVADDSLSVRRALSQLLQDAGYEVDIARDGMEALDRISKQPPAAALLDLEMPQINGLEVTRFMRSQENLRAVPVIMITSRSGDRYAQMAQTAGVNHLLTKPFNDEQLLALLNSMISGQ